MKIGIRKPNMKKRIKARTTGKIKRNIRKTTNPLYGKKGVGYIKNPEKAIKHKIYNKTTISADKFIKRTGNIFVDLFIMLPLSCVYYIFVLYYYILVKFPVWLYRKITKKEDDI